MALLVQAFFHETVWQKSYYGNAPIHSDQIVWVPSEEGKDPSLNLIQKMFEPTLNQVWKKYNPINQVVT